VHAFKGNAANVGADRLIRVSKEAESAGIVEFLRSRDQRLAALRQTFDDTLTALRSMTISTAQSGRDSPRPGTSR